MDNNGIYRERWAGHIPQYNGYIIQISCHICIYTTIIVFYMT